VLSKKVERQKGTQWQDCRVQTRENFGYFSGLLTAVNFAGQLGSKPIGDDPLAAVQESLTVILRWWVSIANPCYRRVRADIQRALLEVNFSPICDIAASRNCSPRKLLLPVANRRQRPPANCTTLHPGLLHQECCCWVDVGS
jgi:hypothetical protein